MSRGKPLTEGKTLGGMSPKKQKRNKRPITGPPATRPNHREEMCVCGHEYYRHFNPKTGQPWGCFFSYNCDCEGFVAQKKK